MTKKNKFKSILIGGLLLSAPFVTFAATNNNDNSDSSSFQSYGFKMGGQNLGPMHDTLLDEAQVSEFQIVKLDSAIEKKIDNANFLISKVLEKNDSSIDTDKLYEIVDEFAQLDSELDTLDLNATQKEDLKTIFLDTKEEATELTTEFRTIISSAFSEEEKIALREELRENNIKVNAQGRGNGQHMGNNNQGIFQEYQIGHVMGVDGMKIIDEDIATKYESGEITFEEAHDLIKEKLESLSEDELQQLRDELRANMPDEGFRRGPHKR